MECVSCDLFKRSNAHAMRSYCNNCQEGDSRKNFCIALEDEGRCLFPLLNLDDEQTAHDYCQRLARRGVMANLLKWNSEAGCYTLYA